jgi:osmoprotectant transport system permease protein
VGDAVDPAHENGPRMSTIVDGFQWLFDPGNWGGRNGIGRAVLQHLWYSLLATAAAVAIALPIGLAIGHTGRGRLVVANVTGIWRAIPTIGVVTIVFRWQPLSVWPVIAALVVLAIPPIVLNTVAGLDSVPHDVRDAAQGMGLTGWQELWQVEVPNGLPLILAGVRSAANQVIATATVAGFVGLGTLGVFMFSAARTQRYNVLAGASIAVIILVLLVEGIFALLQRMLVSEGVRARSPRRLRQAGALPPTTPDWGIAPDVS